MELYVWRRGASKPMAKMQHQRAAPSDQFGWMHKLQANVKEFRKPSTGIWRGPNRQRLKLYSKREA
jgi:hypothetical protein